MLLAYLNENAFLTKMLLSLIQVQPNTLLNQNTNKTLQQFKKQTNFKLMGFAFPYQVVSPFPILGLISIHTLKQD